MRSYTSHRSTFAGKTNDTGNVNDVSVSDRQRQRRPPKGALGEGQALGPWGRVGRWDREASPPSSQCVGAGPRAMLSGAQGGKSRETSRFTAGETHQFQGGLWARTEGELIKCSRL